MKLIMCKGLPGSGKSTWAEGFCRQNPDFIRINKDSIRRMTGLTHKRENLVVKFRDILIFTALTEKKSVIVDDTNLDPKHEFNMRKIVNNFPLPVTFEVKSFLDVPMATCIKQDLKREHSVGEKVIKNMYRQYLEPKIEVPVWNEDLMPAVICDLDGTLAIHVARGPYDMEKLETDAFDHTVLNLLWNNVEDRVQVIFVTGREEKYREATVRWLQTKYPFNNYLLYMRPTDDHREDSIIKQEIYDREIKQKYNVLYVLDDRNRVVEMWRRNGLKCLQVAEGDF